VTAVANDAIVDDEYALVDHRLATMGGSPGLVSMYGLRCYSTLHFCQSFKHRVRDSSNASRFFLSWCSAPAAHFELVGSTSDNVSSR
jgi:hypothetical protein